MTAKEDTNKDTKVEVQDEMSEEMQEDMKEQLLSEIETFTRNLESLDVGLARFKTQFDIDMKLFDLRIAGTRKAEPTFDYETDEYWDLIKQKIEFEKVQSKHMGENQIKQFELQKEEMFKNLASTQEQLDKLVDGEKDE